MAASRSKSPDSDPLRPNPQTERPTANRGPSCHFPISCRVWVTGAVPSLWVPAETEERAAVAVQPVEQEPAVPGVPAAVEVPDATEAEAAVAVGTAEEPVAAPAAVVVGTAVEPVAVLAAVAADTA